MYTCIWAFFPILIMTISAMSLKILSYISNGFKVFRHMNESWFPYRAVHSFLSRAAAALLTTKIPKECSQPSLFPSSRLHPGDSLGYPRSQTRTACGRIGWFLPLWDWLSLGWTVLGWGYFVAECIQRWLLVFWKYKSGSISMQTVGLEAHPSSLYPAPTAPGQMSAIKKEDRSVTLLPGAEAPDVTGVPLAYPNQVPQGLLVPTPTPTSCLTPKTRPASPHPSLPALPGPKSQGSD